MQQLGDKAVRKVLADTCAFAQFCNKWCSFKPHRPGKRAPVKLESSLSTLVSSAFGPSSMVASILGFGLCAPNAYTKDSAGRSVKGYAGFFERFGGHTPQPSNIMFGKAGTTLT